MSTGRPYPTGQPRPSQPLNLRLCLIETLVAGPDLPISSLYPTCAPSSFRRHPRHSGPSAEGESRRPIRDKGNRRGEAPVSVFRLSPVQLMLHHLWAMHYPQDKGFDAIAMQLDGAGVRRADVC